MIKKIKINSSNKAELNELCSKLIVNFQQYNNFTKTYNNTYLQLYRVENNILYINSGFFSADPDNTSLKSDFNFNELKLKIEPRPWQIQAFNYVYNRMLNNEKISSIEMATGSGKSLVITMLCMYFHQMKKSGLILVPNINLLTQFNNDILSYVQDQSLKIVKIGGKNNPSQDEIKNADIIISTWQSIAKYDIAADYVIVDECHKYSGSKVSEILSNIECEYRIGFTGTFPVSEPSKSISIGLFAKPKKIITSRELIDSKCGTNIYVHELRFTNTYKNNQNYTQLLSQITGDSKRNKMICDLVKSLESRNDGSVLVLSSRVQHMNTLFESLSGQTNNPLYIMTSDMNADERELIRNKFEENSVLIANYQLMSTGVNVKNIKYVIFATPIASNITICQSIGRAIRVNNNKPFSIIFEISDSYLMNMSNRRSKIYKQQQIKKISTLELQELLSLYENQKIE